MDKYYYIEVINTCNVQQTEEVVFASRYFDIEKEAIEFFMQLIAYLNTFYDVYLVTVKKDTLDVIKRKKIM